jgi:hypothetical protein
MFVLDIADWKDEAHFAPLGFIFWFDFDELEIGARMAVILLA